MTLKEKTLYNRQVHRAQERLDRHTPDPKPHTTVPRGTWAERTTPPPAKRSRPESSQSSPTPAPKRRTAPTFEDPTPSPWAPPHEDFPALPTTGSDQMPPHLDPLDPHNDHSNQPPPSGEADNVAELRAQITDLTAKLNKQEQAISHLFSLLAKSSMHPEHTKPPPAPAPTHADATRGKSTNTKPTQPACQQRESPPLNPLHRNSDRRLIIDKVIPPMHQRSGLTIVEAVNSLLGQLSADPNTHIDAILYSKNGRPIVIASKSTSAERLHPHANNIFKAIFGRTENVNAYPDYQQFRVKLNSVPTTDSTGEPLSANNVLDHITATASIPGLPSFKLAQPATWIVPEDKLKQRPRSTIVIPFQSREEATQFHKYRDFIVHGERCRTSLYTNHPPSTNAPNPPTNHTTGHTGTTLRHLPVTNPPPKDH